MTACTNAPVSWFEVPARIVRGELLGVVVGARPAQMVKLCRACARRMNGGGILTKGGRGVVELGAVDRGRCGFGFNAPSRVTVFRRRRKEKRA